MSKTSDKIGKFTEDVELAITRETGLNEEQLLDLASVYRMIQQDHKDLIALATAHKVTIAKVYWECEKAQKAIAYRVKQLQDRRDPFTSKKEMP